MRGEGDEILEPFERVHEFFELSYAQYLIRPTSRPVISSALAALDTTNPHD